MYIPTHKTTWYHKAEDSNMNLCYHDNLKYYVKLEIFQKNMFKKTFGSEMDGTNWESLALHSKK